MFSEWKHRRAARRVKPGDGHPMPRFRWWQMLSRTRFHLVQPEPDGSRVTWTVDVRLWGDENGTVVADLYRDGAHAARSTLPARFPIPDGTLEIEASGYGLKRCHLVRDDGSEQQLTPDPRSAEGRRARLASRRPGLSRALGIVSVTVLVIALVLGLPQLVQQVTQIPPIAEHLGTFTSPVALPGWLNVSLVLATLLASTERALRLRYHWLLDGGLFDGDD